MPFMILSSVVSLLLLIVRCFISTSVFYLSAFICFFVSPPPLSPDLISQPHSSICCCFSILHRFFASLSPPSLSSLLRLPYSFISCFSFLSFYLQLVFLHLSHRCFVFYFSTIFSFSALSFLFHFLSVSFLAASSFPPPVFISHPHPSICYSSLSFFSVFRLPFFTSCLSSSSFHCYFSFSITVIAASLHLRLPQF